jgi:hypothetical protein
MATAMALPTPRVAQSLPARLVLSPIAAAIAPTSAGSTAKAP